MSNPDSYIKRGKGFTSFVGQDATRLYAAVTLKSAINMLHKHKIMLTRGANMKRLLSLASEYSGKQYKRGDAVQAMDDLHQWITTMRAALPTITDGDVE